MMKLFIGSELETIRIFNVTESQSLFVRSLFGVENGAQMLEKWKKIAESIGGGKAEICIKVLPTLLLRVVGSRNNNSSNVLISAVATTTARAPIGWRS